MKQIRILLLDLSATGVMYAVLRELLQSAPGMSLSCVQESIDFLKPSGHKRVKDLLLGLGPDVLTLTATLSELDRFRAVYETLGPEAEKIPGVAFIEGNDRSSFTAVILQTGAILMNPAQLNIHDAIALVENLTGRLDPSGILPFYAGGMFRPKQLIGVSSVFLEEVRKIPIVAKYNSSVLIWGETGTGKEICAQMIHALSPRAEHPFVPVNCGALPFELAENELFGHMRGAFTGAVPSKPGLIREAEGGTLFLDEIDSLPPLVQVKLLRFLQDKTYKPLGAVREFPADVRVIAAVNIEPQQTLRSGRLRQDLYHRLNVLSMRLPPLRERKEDIPLLARYFLARNMSETAKTLDGLSVHAVQKLLLHDWPGNVRELERILERAVIFCSGRFVEDFDIAIQQQQEEIDVGASFKEIKEKYIEQFEKSYIERLLMAHQGNISRAAQAAKKHRRAFWELIRKYGIDAEKYKIQS